MTKKRLPTYKSVSRTKSVKHSSKRDDIKPKSSIRSFVDRLRHR